MDKPDVLTAALEATGHPFEIVPCDPALADTAQFCEAYGYSLEQSANAIVVVGKSEPRVYALCLVLANTRLDVNGAVRRRFGVKKASFASADETVALTGMLIGGVTPFGIDHSIPIWIDSRVGECAQVIVGGGSRDRKVLCRPATLLALPTAELVEALANPTD